MGQSDSFEFACPTPGCGQRYRATPALVGKTILCKACTQKVKIPPPSMAARRTSATTPSRADRVGPVGSGRDRPESTAPKLTGKPSIARSGTPGAEEVRCPSCNSRCRVRPEQRGKILECPACKKRFVVPEAKQGVHPAASSSDDSANFVSAHPAADDEVGSMLLDEDDQAGDYRVAEDPATLPPISLPAMVPTQMGKPKKKSSFSGQLQGVSPWVWIVGGSVVFLLFGIVQLAKEDFSGAQRLVFLATYICSMTVFIPLALAVAAVIFRLACRICGEESPTFGQAMLIALVNGVANLIVGFVLELALGLVGNLLAIPIDIVVGAAIYSGMLDVSYGKGIVIFLLQFVISLALVVVIGLLVLVLFLVVFKGSLPAGLLAVAGPGWQPPLREL